MPEKRPGIQQSGTHVTNSDAEPWLGAAAMTGRALSSQLPTISIGDGRVEDGVVEAAQLAARTAFHIEDHDIV